MNLSVIIPCYNGADTIGAQLEALIHQEWSEAWEVIVADNRSTDDSMAIVKHYQEQFPNLRIVDASAKQGQPFAMNVGARQARGKALAFCDADDIVGSGWVPAMGKALSRYDLVACRFDIEKLNPPWVQNSHRNPQENGLQQYSYPTFLPHAGGGGLGVRHSLFEAVGGFDESLPILHDTDFCWRLQLRGTKLYFVPDAVLHVRYRDTIDGIYRQACGYGEYNALLYKRYRPLGMPKLSWQAGLKQWIRLLQRLPRIRHPNRRASFAWLLGTRVGRLKGSIKYRVWAL